jgi:hypothetical protein
MDGLAGAIATEAEAELCAGGSGFFSGLVFLTRI